MAQATFHTSSQDFSQWIDKQETRHDLISAQLTKRIAIIFGEDCPHEGQPLPHLWHWAFFQEPLIETCLGKDGHPVRGIFLPPAEGRNRMWAGGRVCFLQPLIVGKSAKCISTIKAVKEKQGKTGSLLFVTVEHQYFQEGELCLSEEQDIVYREPSPPKLESDSTLPALTWNETVHPTPVMLFRYSAVTFNGHRIHYDHPYATEQEGYPGLVVHGPMIATLILHSFIKQYPQCMPKNFTYRGLRPLIADTSFHIGGHHQSDQHCTAWAFNNNGPAHQAEIEYKESI